MLYILYYAIVVLLAYFGQESSIASNNKKHQKLYRVLVAVLMSIPVAALTVGTDKEIYTFRYLSVVSFSDAFSDDNIRNYSWEYGYSLLCWLGHLLNLGPKMFLFLISFITNLLIVRVLYKYPMPFFAVLCFVVSSVYSQENNLIRQTLASAIFLNGLVLLENGKSSVIKYVLILCIASLFHKSAMYLSFIALIPLMKLIDKKILYYLVIIIWIASLLIYFEVINVDFLDYLTLISDQTYEGYFSSYNTTGVAVANLVEFLTMNLLLFISIINRPRFDIIVVVMLLAVCGTNIRESLPNLARFFYYFSIIIPVYIVTLMYNLMEEKSLMKWPIVNWIIIGYVVVYQFVYVSLRGGHTFFE